MLVQGKGDLNEKVGVHLAVSYAYKSGLGLCDTFCIVLVTFVNEIYLAYFEDIECVNSVSLLSRM